MKDYKPIKNPNSLDKSDMKSSFLDKTAGAHKKKEGAKDYIMMNNTNHYKTFKMLTHNKSGRK